MSRLGEGALDLAKVALALLVGVAPQPGVAARPEACEVAAACQETLRVGGAGTIPYHRSVPISLNPAVGRAAVVVHGNRRDGDRYFERLVASARAEGRLHDTALFAPVFRTAADGPGPGELHWSSHGWKMGNRSRDPARVSAFAVMDALLAEICPAAREAFPGLSTVALIGHSAGGQFVARYAAGGAGCPDPAVEVRYVVMNPSSYLYVDARRPLAGGGFGIPLAYFCADYDDYKYGLRGLNRYLRRVGPERVRRNLFERHTVYLAGDADVRVGGSLDTSCSGNLQGKNRLMRHANYRAYHELFPAWTGATFDVVPEVAHEGGKMLLSDAARRAAFR